MTSTARRRLSADERREQIIDSAREVFSRSGLAGARTRDLAAEAGVNEALLYRHFKSKDELFDAAVAEPLERAVATLVELSGTPPEVFDSRGELMFERTRGFIHDLLLVMDEVAPLLGIVLFGDADSASEYYRRRISPSLDGVKQVIDANLDSWTHREFDAELLIHGVFGMAWFLSITAHLGGPRWDLDRAATQIASVLLEGVMLKGEEE
jgi:AcrR family transcriptional regulator